MKYFKLFEPLKIRNITVRNRFIIPAMHLNATEDGTCNDRIVEFYKTRAKGGFGMIIVGGIGVSKRAMGVPMMLAIYDDKFIEPLKKLTNAVHSEGAKICAQLYHAGAYAFSKLIGERAVSSSAVYSNFTHETPRELSTEEVGEVIENIAQAALRAKKAGFDAVEILSSAGYLIDQFLSPIKNKRTDKYGGKTIEERLTFPLEVIKRVRELVGDEFVVGARLSGDDFVKGSNTYKEKKIVAKAYERAGIDYINVTGGWHETRVPQIPMNTPRGAFAYLAKEIKSVVSIPVFSSNRINDPALGERLLQDFYADAICFGRASIAEPYLPLKIKNGMEDEIVHCIGCNQGCFDSIFNLKPLHCTVNPYALNEYKYHDLPTTDKKLKVIVVGGGPAGMEAALRAHLLGHDVKLFEKSDKLGGQLNVAWIPPGRKDIKYIIEDYEKRLKKYGVHYELNSPMTPESIMAEEPDVVFIATGVHFKIPPIEGIDGSLGCDICFADEALAGDHLVGKRVVVVGASATGVETAIWAAERGAMPPEVARFLAFYNEYTHLGCEELMERTFRGDREVYLLEYLPKIGTSIGKSTRWVMAGELKKLNIDVRTNVNITKFENNSVYYFNRDDETREIHSIDNIDTVILATGVTPNRDLSKELKDYIKNNPDAIKKKPIIKEIGDAKKVGTALDAIHSAFKAAIRLKRFTDL